MRIPQDQGMVVNYINIIFLLFMMHTLCFGQSTWEWRNPLPQGNTLMGVTYADNQFVAVGGNGTILTSPDGTTWTIRNSGTFRSLFSVAYGDSQFVSVGDSIIANSRDGITWTTNNFSAQLSSVVYGNGTFVAVGSPRAIYTSIDGTTWTAENSAQSNERFTSVTYGNGQFMAVGYNILSSSYILSSPDGITWKGKNYGNDLYSVCYGDSQFIAVGDPPCTAISSKLGTIKVDTIRTTNHLLSIAYGGGLFVIGSNQGAVYASADGANWTANNSGARLNSIIYGKGKFVAVGDYGILLSSSDGKIWAQNTLGLYCSTLTCVTHGDNQFVAVSLYGAILTSPEGITWTIITWGTDKLLYSVTYGNSRFVAVGDEIRTSSDATKWTTLGNGRFYSVTYGDNRFVAVGNNGMIYTSIDTSVNGMIWSKENSGTTGTLYSVTYGDSQFIAVGDSILLNSTDGITWIKKTFGTTARLKSITYGNNKFVALGSSGTILTSSDGMAWTTDNIGATSMRSVAYGDNQFIAIGDNGTILTTPDCITWTKRNSGTDNTLYSVTCSGNQFIAVGNGSTILASKADFPTPVTSRSIAKQTTIRKVCIVDNRIIVKLPYSPASKQVKVALFTFAGKTVYSATTEPIDGILTIPCYGLSTGIYLMSISRGDKNTWSLPFVLTK